MKRLLYRYFSRDYLFVICLIANHYREKRIRAGFCYAPGCQQDGIVWLDRSGIYCWDHYCAEMASQRQSLVGGSPTPSAPDALTRDQ